MQSAAQTPPPVPMPVIPLKKKSGGSKIPAPIALFLVLVLVSGGAWFVYDQIFADHRVDLSQYEATPRPSYNADFNPGPRQPRFQVQQAVAVPATVINRDNGKAFDIRVPGVRARFTGRDGTFTVEGAYTDPSYLPMPDRWAQTARWTALSDEPRAREAKVTPEQVTKLKAVNFPTNMVLSDANRTKLLEMLSEYQKTAGDKTAMEKTMGDTLRQVANDSTEATKQAFGAAANEVRAILSAQQISQLRGRN